MTVTPKADDATRGTRSRPIAVLAAVAAALTLAAAACGTTSTSAGPAATGTTTGATGSSTGLSTGAATTDEVLPVAVQSLDITGTEYAFAVQPTGGTLQPGWTKVTFHNRGGEAHQVMFARLKDGVDLAALGAAAGGDSSGSKAIEYVDMLGGVSYIGPGRTTEAMVELPAGTILAMCYVPDAHGKAHALSGMTTMLSVGEVAASGPGTTATASSRPAATEAVRGTIVMDADGYHLPSTLPAGWYHVVNSDGGGAGQGLHELSILGLRDELTDDGLRRLLDDLATNATPTVPLDALGGMGALSGGLDAYLYLDLAPGPYLAVDFMPDPGQPRPHLLDGYVTPFRA